jgi:[acyl-carrier-protein] S-malonyltransferase
LAFARERESKSGAGGRQLRAGGTLFLNLSANKTAFLFPGQGSQFPGMGKSLAERFDVARETFAEADAALAFRISELCFNGPESDLKLTENTQPALLAVSIAAFRVLRQQGVAPDYVAGHSLGEYSALVAAGSLQFGDALRLVRKRGRYMQEAVPPGAGAMAALLKLPEGKLEAILEQAAQGEVVTAANLNSPDQVVIAGHAAAVQRAIDLAKAAGARRAVLLPVSAPFHCPLMSPAQQRLSDDLNATPFGDLTVPLVNNWQARLIRTGAEAREGLYQQVPNPVRWADSMRVLAAEGAGRFVEVGAGAVLTGLLRNIDPALQGVKFGEADDWEKVHAAVA